MAENPTTANVQDPVHLHNDGVRGHDLSCDDPAAHLLTKTKAIESRLQLSVLRLHHRPAHVPLFGMADIRALAVVEFRSLLLGALHLAVSQLLLAAADCTDSSLNARPRHHLVCAVLTVHPQAAGYDHEGQASA